MTGFGQKIKKHFGEGQGESAAIGRSMLVE